MKTLSILALAALAATASAAEKPNVLFIASDDMRPQLGCYGDPTMKSPHLDALAKRGMVFRRSYVQQALCSPSRISMLSGRYPATTGIFEIGRTLRTTMPDITGETDPVTHECQKNFTLLSTDGKWNDNYTGTNNRDLTVPVLPVAVTGLTPGQPWPFPIREGTTATSNTLADIALRYWATDLRAAMTNNVPADPADPASWQHMTTYTLGFGVKGTLDYPGALPGLTAGTTRWPTPVSNADTTVDDLWHAGINGFGGYLSAQDPNELVTSLETILSDLGSRVTSSSSVAANTTQLNTGARIYRARFDSGDWSGQLQSFKLSSVGAISAGFEWDASDKLALRAGNSSDSRMVITWNSGKTGETQPAIPLVALQGFLER